ncbi:DNA-binding protein [Methylobacterium sp. SI9]|uniref:DNA-binding protein n=1 Tax=Methylobacterium guangdongense TaxID=3138811 RepID=UPI00313DCAC5
MSEDIIAVLTNPTVDVQLAGRVLGVGKNAAYKAVGNGTIPTITVGGRKRVPTAKLREMLGLPAQPPAAQIAA